MTEFVETLEEAARRLASLHDTLQVERGRATAQVIGIMSAAKAGLDVVSSLLETGQTARALDVARRQADELERGIAELNRLRPA